MLAISQVSPTLRSPIASGAEPIDLQSCKATYERLRPSTAQQVLRFHRMQQQNEPAA